MDQVKVGKYIALLRRQAGLTQEQLGEKLGVTNKTVSRWENGNYMPDIEMFGLIAKEFNVSINDLLAGERIPDEDFRQRADENIIAVATSSVFSIDERRTYLKRKWRKEHIFLFVIMGIVLLAVLILPFIIKKPLLMTLSPLIAVIEYGGASGCAYAAVPRRGAPLRFRLSQDYCGQKSYCLLSDEGRESTGVRAEFTIDVLLPVHRLLGTYFKCYFSLRETECPVTFLLALLESDFTNQEADNFFCPYAAK